jgi:hypothetical protein
MTNSQAASVVISIKKNNIPRRQTPPGDGNQPSIQTKRGLWLAPQLLSFTGSQPKSVFASIKKDKTPVTNAPGMGINLPYNPNVDYGLRGSLSQ